jgi:hypothetical protein
MLLALKLCDTLSEARNESRFQPGDEVDLLSPNNDPLITLRWHSQRQEYEIVEIYR